MKNKEYIRIGTDYFKIITKPDRFGIDRKSLKRWTRQELVSDEGTNFIKQLDQYDDFVLNPDNINPDKSINNCYNLYNEFAHTARKPKTSERYKGLYWTSVLMREIFGDQFKIGFQYLKVLYENPKQALPVLVLVSEERSTGKSTFLDWLNAIFGDNMAMVEPEAIGHSFNGSYAGANIIGIDETVIEKKSAVEKIKSLATSKFITMNRKFVEPFKIPFYGKIIMATNNADDFMRVDSEEIRFWVRRLSKPRITNHDILEDCISEIPALIYYLNNMPDIDYKKVSRMVFTAEQINNPALQAVKAQSRSGLYKEIEEMVVDWFYNNPSSTELRLTPKDMKEKWFDKDSRISVNYIRRVLKKEFGMDAGEVQKYSPFEVPVSMTGRPFVFERSDMIEVEVKDISDPLPF